MALRIAKVGLEIEKKFGHPQDIELVIANQDIFIVQTRNITTNIH
jgi:phosphoenolpyruvate synthase/pyruvate phosphate dikinase